MRLRLVALGFVLAVCPAALSQASAASPPSSTAAVTSLAGPGYCAASARRDATSASVRALALDALGDVFFDTGPPAAGSVARVAPDGTVSLLATGVPSGRPTASPGVGSSLIPIPGRLAADGSGGVILAAGARLIDVDANGSPTTIAGDPGAIGYGDGTGSSGDGGPATTARFARASSVATDAAGNVFVADVSGGSVPHAVIRFINRGSGPMTFFDGAPGAVRVGPGDIATIAGRASQVEPTAEPNVTPSAARGANLPGGAPVMAVAGDRLYVGVAAPDARFARVLAVDLGREPLTAQGVTLAAGQIAAVTGGGIGATPAASFPLSTITGMAATQDGGLYLAEEAHHRVLHADASGHLSVLAGRAGGRESDAGFDGNGRPASGTRLNQPFDVKLGGGRVYIADQANDEVRAVDTDGVIRAVGGGGIATRWACSGGTTSERYGSTGAPTAVVADPSGVFYVALPPLNRVQRIDLAGIVTTVAGGGAHDARCRDEPQCAGFSGDGGPAADARLDRPTALALGAPGELYVLDAGNARVRLVNLGEQPIQAHGVTVAPGDIATVAGSGTPGAAGDGGAALRARILGAPGYARRADSIQSQIIDPRLYTLGSLAAGRDGALFIAGGPDKRVRRVDGSGVITSVTAVADPASGRCCSDPVAVAEDAAADLYVADRGTDDAGVLHPRIWVTNRSGHAATILGTAVPRGVTVAVAGDGTFGTDGDGGPALGASFGVPLSIAAARNGSVFVAEAGVSTGLGVRFSDVRAIDPAGLITTAAGAGAVAFNGDGLPALLTDLALPSGVSADRCGNLVVADTGNDRVRRALLAGTCPPIGEAGSEDHGLPGALLPAVLGAAAVAVSVTATIVLRARLRGRAAPIGRRSETTTPRR